MTQCRCRAVARSTQAMRKFLAEIAKARARASRRGTPLQFVASVTGTDGDPQSATAQRRRLLDAGVAVLDSNAEAARFAALLVRPELQASHLEP